MMALMLKSAYYGVSVLEMFSIAKKIQLEVIKTGFFDLLQTEFLIATWPAPFSAKPHGVPPVDGKLKDGPLAAMSYLWVNGYAAECERTFCLAPPTEQHQQMFAAMEEARKRAFAKICPGVKAADVDKAAMDYLKEVGYGEYLLHRTGHGIGQGNHEGPWVAEGSDHILGENMVISVEPGIYIPDIGGVRHSDTVLVTKEGYECLTHYPTDPQSLTILKSRPLKKFKGKIIQKAVGMK
jgi:Xaa-Pro aminopeptidase